MSLTDHYEQGILNHLCNNTALASPTTVYGQLATATPAEDESGVGSAVGNRIALSFAADVTAGATTDADATFDGITPGAVVTHILLWDASVAGNVIVYDTIKDADGVAVSITVGASGEITFLAGNITFTLD